MMAKIMEDVIREQKAFVESLLQSAAVPLFVIDKDHKVIAWNRACEELTGVKGAEVIGTRRHWKAFYDHERPCLADIVLERQRGKISAFYDVYSKLDPLSEGLQAEGWFPALGGKPRYVFFNAAPVCNAAGEIVAVIETLLDITERKKAEEKIAAMGDYYLRLFQKFPALIWRSGVDAKCNFFNDTWLEFTGRTLEEELNEGWSEGVHPDDLERCASVYLKAFGARQSFTVEYRLRRHDGEYRWIIDNGRPFYDPHGFFAGYIGSCHDITERRQMEEKLRRSQEELLFNHEQLRDLFKQVELVKKEWEDTLDCIGDIVILTDREGYIRRCNRATCELTGTAHEEILGKNWQEILPTWRGKDESGEEVYHPHSKRWFYISYYPFKEAGQDEVTGAVITLHDRTRIKEVTKDLESAYAELKETQAQMFQKEKMASIGQLAAGIAHEINNPIGFITSNIGTLGKYTEKMTEFIAAQEHALAEHETSQTREELGSLRRRLKLDYILEDIRQLITESLEGADRVKKIVQDLKTFSRMDEAEHKVADLVECLESTLNIAWNELKYKVTLKKEYGDIPPVKCYPQQLNQVFLNLLVNAAQAIDNQGTITVRAWQQDNSIYISVSDTGCGIPDDIRNRIFDPFFTTKEVGKGTGLGLSISYDIVKKHCGDLFVDTEVGKGTTFIIRLPVT